MCFFGVGGGRGREQIQVKKRPHIPAVQRCQTFACRMLYQRTTNLVFRRDSLCRFSYSSDMISITFWVQKVYSASPAWVPSWLAKWMMSPFLCFQLSRPFKQMLQWPLYILYPWMVNASMSSLVLQEHSHVVSGNYWHDPAGRRASFRWNFASGSLLPVFRWSIIAILVSPFI